MMVEAWAACDESGWEGAMPGEPVYISPLGLSLSQGPQFQGMKAGAYVRGPVDGRILVRVELVNPHPNYLFRCSA